MVNSKCKGLLIPSASNSKFEFTKYRDSNFLVIVGCAKVIKLEHSTTMALEFLVLTVRYVQIDVGSIIPKKYLFIPTGGWNIMA